LCAFAITAACLAPALGNAATIVADISVNFATAAQLQPTVDGFRGILGPNNGNNPVNADPNGRRQIDWDAAPDAVAEPNAFPGDFFNFSAAPRARGIEFEETGDTKGFALSATEASGQQVGFGFPGSFVPFSPERLFTPIGGTTFDVKFFSPLDQVTQAVTRGLGVIFSDVETAGSTSMTFFDIAGNILAERFAEAGPNAGFSFIGLAFDEAVIASVSIQSGTSALLGNGRVGNAGDSVAMDDFIFGEPVPVSPVPLPAGAVLLLTGIGALALRRKA
jgi:hypothetical protein